MEFPPFVMGASARARPTPSQTETESERRDRTGVSSSGFLSSVPGAPFLVRTATTSRLLIDLSDRRRLLSMLAPGQSEHPGHPNFADGLDGWRAGQQRRLAMSPFLVGEATVERLVLSPGR
jgi:acyl-homoserine lactone acylase PvdQ